MLFDLLQAIAEGRDTSELMKKHEQELAALEASFDAEEARHTAEITKSLKEEYMEEVKQAHKALLDKVCRTWGINNRTPEVVNLHCITGSYRVSISNFVLKSMF